MIDVPSYLQSRWTRFLELVVIVLMLLSHEVTADNAGCDTLQRDPNKNILNFETVQTISLERNKFNGSHKNFSKVCGGAFAETTAEIIDLSFNNLSSLPEDIFRDINNLRKVYLNNNPFIAVPPALNATETITFLKLADTKIRSISRYSINGMFNLKTLDLSRTELTTVPEDIFYMSSLQNVLLSQTNLTRLPFPPFMSAPLNVTMSNANGILSISSKREININVTGVEMLTCDGTKTAVESTYCLPGCEIVCDYDSFDKIDIVLEGRSGLFSPCTQENAATTFTAVTNEVDCYGYPGNLGHVCNATAPSSKSKVSGSSQPRFFTIILVTGSAAVGVIIGGLLVLLLMLKCTSRRREASPV